MKPFVNVRVYDPQGKIFDIWQYYLTPKGHFPKLLVTLVTARIMQGYRVEMTKGE